jgi:hypothetical protein
MPFRPKPKRPKPTEDMSFLELLDYLGGGTKIEPRIHRPQNESILEQAKIWDWWRIKYWLPLGRR